MIKGLIILLLTVVVGIFIYYNRRILGAMAKQKDNYENILLRYVGTKVSKFHNHMEKVSNTRNKTTFSRLDSYFDSILVNLDMKREHVTTTGFMLFIFTISSGIGLSVSIIVGNIFLAIFLCPAMGYFIIIGFKFISIVRFEKKEALIMDVEDLLATDITGGGVYNAIKRYSKNFHPDIRIYFDEFLDNMQTKNMSFKSSMIVLNDRLGRSFDSFAQKAMMYEESAEENMDDMFSAVIDKNRRKRDIRERNNRKFTELRTQFIVSLFIIVLYFVFMVITDMAVRNFFFNTVFGNVLIIVDVLIVTAVMAYMASIKASFLD